MLQNIQKDDIVAYLNFFTLSKPYFNYVNVFE